MTGDSVATEPPRPAGRPSLWRDHDFRTFWIGDVVSQFGDRVTELAVPLIAILELHASPTQVGTLGALVWLPNLVSLFVGSWVDQHAKKRRLLIIADLIRAALLATVPIAWALDSLALGQLYAVALLTGAASTLFNTSYPSFFVALVAKDDYLQANSLVSTSRSVSFIAGPAVGGGLIQLLTAPLALLVDTLSFLWSAAMIARVRTADIIPDRSDTAAVWRRAVAGMRYVVRHPYLRYSLGCATTGNFFTFMSFALVVLFASRTLGLEPGAIGLAFGVGATGGLLGAVTAPRLSRRIGVGRSILLGSILFPLPIAIVSFAYGPEWLTTGVVALSEFLSGIGVMVFDINLNAVQASVIPNDMRSRVSGAFSTINYGVRPLGSLIGGLLGSTIGIRPTLVIAAVGGSLGALWLLAGPIPGVRDLDELPPADTFR